jgi:hypothetical protein
MLTGKEKFNKMMKEQEARGDQIKAKMQSRVDEIKKKEAEHSMRCQAVTDFNTKKRLEGLGQVDGQLSDYNNRI